MSSPGTQDQFHIRAAGTDAAMANEVVTLAGHIAMNSKSLPVVVVGAGPVGLLAALELARRQVPVVVLETEPSTTIDLRAGTFHPPTLEMLQAPGVTDAMLALGIRVPVWQSRDIQEGLIASWDLSVLAGDTPFPYRLHLEQHRLTPILLELLQRHPHAEVRFGHEFTGFEDKGDHIVAIANSAGQTVRLDGRWLIGADGGRSVTRKAADIEFDGYTWPERYTVISTTFDFAPLGYADNAYASDPQQWAAFFRMPDKGPPGLWRMTLPVAQELSDEQVLASDFAQGVIRRILRDESMQTSFPIVHQSIYRVHQRVATRFKAGRVLLAGDSAHVNNPLGGFGLNSGIHDAVNLGEKLARVYHGEASDDLLDLYERQRRTVNIEYVQNMSVRNKKNLEEVDPQLREQRFKEMREIAADRDKTRDYLLTTSMIKSIERANAIA
jgi:3-(3-hydroxy-phenyl)propionate hydroxylase